MLRWPRLAPAGCSAVLVSHLTRFGGTWEHVALFAMFVRAYFCDRSLSKEDIVDAPFSTVIWQNVVDGYFLFMDVLFDIVAFPFS